MQWNTNGTRNFSSFFAVLALLTTATITERQISSATCEVNTKSATCQRQTLADFAQFIFAKAKLAK